MAPVWEFGAAEPYPEVTETGTLGGASKGDPLAAMLETLNGSSEDDMDTIVSFFRQGALTSAEDRRRLAATNNATKNAQHKSARREDPSTTSLRDTIRQRSSTTPGPTGHLGTLPEGSNSRHAGPQCILRRKRSPREGLQNQH